MQIMSSLEPIDSSATVADDAGSIGAGRILPAVFETLDGAGIPYCVLHGYEDYPQRITSDVDCVVDPGTAPGRLVALLHRHRDRIGAEVVRCSGSHIVLAGKAPDGSTCFLTLDVSVDCELDGLPFYSGAEVLASRRRYRQFWIPAADVAFGGYLARTIAKGRVDDERGRRLGRLYREDPAGCERQVSRFWGAPGAELILSAARTGNWEPVRRHLDGLRAELRRRAMLRRPGRFLRNRLHGQVDRLRRVWRPDGLNLVLLGPDGAGKSSVTDALGPRLAGVFARSACWGFAPAAVQRLLHGRNRSTDTPHALPPRSVAMSVARAVLYWFVYYQFGYVIRRLAMARSTLVLNDRHFVDVLVDPKRYRYGGPGWLVRLIWRVIPKPDLIVVLDAPPEVLQARKQEVSFAETARQRGAYRALAQSLRNGHVVDATRPLERVAGDVTDIVLRHLSMRVARRFGLGPDAARAGSRTTALPGV